MNITGEQVRAAYAQAPEEVRRTFASEETTNTIIAIQRRYQLHIDISGVLGKQVGWLLLGLMSPMEFLGGLVDAGVSGDVAKAIVTDVNEQIFAPLRARMQGAPAATQAAPVQPIPAPAPSVPQTPAEPVWPQPSALATPPAPVATPPQPAWPPAATVHVYIPPQPQSPITASPEAVAPTTPQSYPVPQPPPPTPTYTAPAPTADSVPLPTQPRTAPPPPNLPGATPEPLPIHHENDPYREPI